MRPAYALLVTTALLSPWLIAPKASAKWTCTAQDLVTFNWICLGQNPVPVQDTKRQADETAKLAAEEATKKETEQTKTAQQTIEKAIGGTGAQASGASSSTPPPKNTLGELYFGPKDQTKDMDISGQRESEWQKKQKLFTDSIIDATVLALTAKRKVEEDSKEIAQLMQQAEKNENLRSDLAFNAKLQAKHSEVQLMKQALIGKLADIKAKHIDHRMTSDQTRDLGNKAPTGNDKTNVVVDLTDSQKWQREQEELRQSLAMQEFFAKYGQPYEDTPALTPEQQKAADVDQLSLSLQKSMGLSKEQADALAKQISSEMDQTPGSQEDKARQQALKMQQDPTKYGLTKEQAEQAAKDAKSYGDPNAPGRKTQVTAENAKDFTGRYIGVNQECASLTKAFAPGVGPASTWQPGQQLSPSNLPAVGTPVATFNNGAYGPPGAPGGASGYSHTGIFVGSNAQGFQILDQYNGSGGAKITTIPWSKTGYQGADKYHVIK